MDNRIEKTGSSRFKKIEEMSSSHLKLLRVGASSSKSDGLV